MSSGESQTVLDWAAGGSATSDEPPWASFDYLKLRQTLEEIVSGMAAATQFEGLPPPEPQAGGNHRFLVIDAEPENAEPDASEPPANPS